MMFDRYFKSAKKFKADIVVRICGDCPLIDPKVVDEISKILQKINLIMSLILQPSYPDGLDVEVSS